MANIASFRGTRYDLQKVGELADVVTMPYDRIKHGRQDTYYARSDYNICRVIKGKEFAEDHDGNNVYTRAGDTWRVWLDQGIVKEDHDPAIYAYYQVFRVGGDEYTRRGFCAMVELQDYESGGIKAHEKTLEGPKADRLKLLLNTDTHFGQIFQLYPDDDNVVAELLAQHTGREPDMETIMPEEPGVVHRMWAVTDPTTISAVQEAMADRLLFIADGHHRYETALNYRNLCLERYTGGINGQGPRYAMMTMVGMSDPGLVVLPTLRVVHDVPGFDIHQLKGGLKEHFSLITQPSLEVMQARLDGARGNGRNAFGLYCAGRCWYFELTDKQIMEQLCPQQSLAWRSLDVSVLHELVMEKILGITKEAQAAKTNIDYERESAYAVKSVDSGSHQAAFFMNPTRLEQIREVAGKGEVMPQKSTDFYPKLISGMVASQVDLGRKK